MCDLIDVLADLRGENVHGVIDVQYFVSML